MAAGIYAMRLNQLDSSYLVLGSLALLSIAAGFLFYMGFINAVLAAVERVFRAIIRKGFRVWELFLAWASWPIFLALVLALALAGLIAEDRPVLMLLCALALLFLGVVACLAYMFIDLERYEVERGYKAVHNPLKGQEPAHYVARYSHRVGVFLLVGATIGMIAGFALLNQALFLTIGRDWYRVREGFPEPAFANFLAYTLIHVLQIVDVLDLANSHQLVQTSYVRQVAWPAWTILLTFKVFITWVLLRQLFTSIRQDRLLGETIADFWSPHQPIQERARSALPQYGAVVIGPLLLSVRSVPFLTKEQRDQLPLILAAIGPSTLPILIRYLRDPHEDVRATAVAALGQLHATSALPLLVPLAQDPSEMVRQSVVTALGELGSVPAQKLRVGRFRGRRWLGNARLFGWLRRRRGLVAQEPRDFIVTVLAGALQDTSPAVRAQAALALARIGPPHGRAAVPALKLLLQDSGEAVRCQAAEALGRVGAEDATTVSALVELLEDPSASVKVAAAEALGALKVAAAAALPALLPLLGDGQEAVRAAAASAIAQLGRLSAAAAGSLSEGLASPDNLVRAHTAETLGTIGPSAKDAAPALVEALEADASDRVRAKAVQALGKIGEAAADIAVPSLTRALRDQDVWVGALAAEALGQMGESADEAVPALVRALGHVNPLVRSNTAQALGRMGEAARSARTALETAAHDADGSVRSEAALALGAIGTPTPTSEQTVLGALRDADPLVRSAAVKALGEWGRPTPAWLAALMPLLEDPNDQVKVHVIQVLAKLAGPTPAMIQSLCRRLLDDNSPWVQEQAAQALGKLGPPAAAAGEALLRAAQTAEVSVREQAMRAIALIQPPETAEAFCYGLKDASSVIRKLASGGWMKADAIPAQAIPALVEALKDTEVQVRANAAHALARLGSLPPESIPSLLECAADLNDALRVNAAMALKLAPPDVAAKALRGLIDDPNVRVRLVAASAILANDSSCIGARTVVVQALEDPTPRVQQAARELMNLFALQGADIPDAAQTPRPAPERAEVAV